MSVRFEIGTDGPTAIVVGVDGSETSLRAAAYAIGQARRQHARLVVVYVRPFVPTLIALSAGYPMGLVVAHTGEDDVEATLREAFEELASAIDARFVVRVGEAYAQLSEVAREVGADAVIVGASMGFGHRLGGSVASRLVRAGRWPVTVVP